MIPRGASLVIVAGGKSTRMGRSIKKELAEIEGESVLCKTLKPFLETALFSEMVIVLPLSHLKQTENMILSCIPPHEGCTLIFTEGGATRQQSVYRGLCALTASSQIVLIHDGARPWVTTEIIFRVYEKANEKGAAIPVVPSVNALKEIDAKGQIIRSLNRSAVVGAQTPQGFIFSDILAAHRKAAAENRDYPDDAEVFSAYSGEVFTVQGDIKNKKITYREDLEA